MKTKVLIIMTVVSLAAFGSLAHARLPYMALAEVGKLENLGTKPKQVCSSCPRVPCSSDRECADKSGWNPYCRCGGKNNGVDPRHTCTVGH